MGGQFDPFPMDVRGLIIIIIVITARRTRTRRITIVVIGSNKVVIIIIHIKAIFKITYTRGFVVFKLFKSWL